MVIIIDQFPYVLGIWYERLQYRVWLASIRRAVNRTTALLKWHTSALTHVTAKVNATSLDIIYVSFFIRYAPHKRAKWACRGWIDESQQPTKSFLVLRHNCHRKVWSNGFGVFEKTELSREGKKADGRWKTISLWWSDVPTIDNQKERERHSLCIVFLLLSVKRKTNLFPFSSTVVFARDTMSVSRERGTQHLLGNWGTDADNGQQHSSCE